MSRLTSLAHDPSGSAHDQSWDFDHNPAGQIVSQTAALSGWGWTMGSNYSEAYTAPFETPPAAAPQGEAGSTSISPSPGRAFPTTPAAT